MSNEMKKRGRSRETLELIATCINLVAEVQPITVRGVCYKLFVAGLIDSMAVKNTQKVSRLLVMAREQGLIPWEWIVDDSRRMEGDGGFTDLAQYARFVEAAYTRDFWAHQPNRVIVISEKATVSGILRPVLTEYGVPFMALHGFNSATKVHELASEIARDPRLHVLLYVGDYDPSGMFMSEMDLPARLESYGSGPFSFKRIALVESDLSSLPDFDAKRTDPRHSWFVDNYGHQAWELDALSPNELRDRVRQEIASYIDAGAWAQHQKIEAAQRATTREIARRLAAAGA